MAGIDLDSKHLALTLDIVRRHADGARVLAFGSRTDGTAHPGSDLDLAVVWPENTPSNANTKLKTAFSESDLPFTVDVLDWHEIPEEFRRRISSQNIELTDDAIPRSNGGDD